MKNLNKKILTNPHINVGVFCYICVMIITLLITSIIVNIILFIVTGSLNKESKVIMKPPSVVYKDRIVYVDRVIEKPITKVVYKTKTVEKPVVKEVEKIVYVDRPVTTITHEFTKKEVPQVSPQKMGLMKELELLKSKKKKDKKDLENIYTLEKVIPNLK